jgi:Amt family ammonium transporter
VANLVFAWHHKAQITCAACLIVLYQTLLFHPFLDDIGVGFSSFQYLAPLSIRSIKIRGDLIRNLHIANNYNYVSVLCKTCYELGIEVVTKFVEDLTLLDTLHNIGVDYAQGFALGRPLEAMDMVD